MKNQYLNKLLLFLIFPLYTLSQSLYDVTSSANNELFKLKSDKKFSQLILKSYTDFSHSNFPDKKIDFNGVNPGQDFTAVKTATDKIKKKKSVGLGVLLSALLPGAGEFYGESYLKAGIFLGVEILAWATYFYFDTKGDKKDEEFRKFADENWDVRRYARWLNDQFQQNINWQEPDLQELRRQIIMSEQELRFSHTLPEYYTQQYYELIGKYQTFMGGWADAENGFGNWVVTGGQGGNYYTYQTSMFKYYAGERQKANDFYDLAKIGPITAILNHILSAADAAWTISRYNKRLRLETGFRIHNYSSPYTQSFQQVPTFNLRFSF